MKKLQQNTLVIMIGKILRLLIILFFAFLALRFLIPNDDIFGLLAIGATIALVFLHVRELFTVVTSRFAFPSESSADITSHNDFNDNEPQNLSSGSVTSDSQPINIVTPHFRRRSYFFTTDRNLLLYWFANLIIYPVYGMCVILFLYYLRLDLSIDLPENIWLAVRTLSLIIFFIPIISTFYLQRYWHQGFIRREILVIVSAVLYVLLLARSENPKLINIFIFITSLLWLMFTAVQIFNRWNLRIPALLITSSLFIALIIWISHNESFIGDSGFYHLIIIGWSVLAVVAVLYSIWRMLRIAIEYVQHHPPKQHIRYLVMHLSSVGIGIGFVCVASLSEVIWLRMLAGILLLVVASDPNTSYSRHVAGLRNALHQIRHDRLNHSISPTHKLEHWFNRSTNKIRSVVRLTNRRLFISLAFFLGGIVVPVAYFVITVILASDINQLNLLKLLVLQTSGQVSIPIPSLFELIAVGVVGSTTLMTIYLTGWFINNRSSYIVTRFEVTSSSTKENSDPELLAIANLTTHILVEELQKIATILHTRQVEDVRFSNDERGSFFVTSGNDQDFINQMQQISNIETPANGNINLGQLLAVALKLLAKIRVEGRVQRRSNNSVEIWVQLAYGGNNTAAVDQVIVPENSIQEIDEISIRPIARELALKLYIAMGQVGHLSTSVASLDALLIGMESVAEKEWWRAIRHYRKALEFEETFRRNFGIGHYHLGATLSYQGDWLEGLDHLRTAEIDGPPLAELQYMIALILLNRYWTELYEKPSIFVEIRDRLQMAIQLRPAFAEAHHLLGTASYRRGRLHERVTTSGYKNVKDSKNYHHHFRKAEYHFRKALKLYDKQEKLNNYSTINTYSNHRTRANNTLQQRITVAHQLADALRILGLYAEADTYYRDMMAVYPRNLRNLTDLAKTHCLSENWQVAEEFLWNSVFNDDIAYWDADVCIHMGWALLGGITDSLSTSVKRITDYLTRRMYGHKVDDKFIEDQTGRWLEMYNEPQRTIHIFTLAIQYIDYAIHQRPRYITYYSQTDWWNPLQRAFVSAEQIAKPSIGNPLLKYIDQIRPEHYANTNMKLDHLIRLKHHKVWLGLRIYGFGIYSDTFDDRGEKINLERFGYKEDALEFLDYAKQHSRSFYDLHLSFYKCRDEIIDFYVKEGQQRLTGGLWMNYKRLQIANKLCSAWEKFLHSTEYQEYKSKMDCSPFPDFMDRWKLEVIAEFAMLTCRMLTEGRAYEQVFEVATTACEVLRKWTKWWQDSYKDKGKLYDYYTFSPRINRYHHASLLAWKGLALYQCRFDRVSKARCDYYATSNHSFKIIKTLADNNRDVLHDIQKYINDAQRHIKNHPLTNFVQALVYNKSELHAKAVEELEHLLDIIRPYDPKQPFSSESFSPTNDLDSTRKSPDKSRRSRMYYMERISGRQQFYDLLNNPQIHSLIADIYKQMGKPDLRVQQLMEAIRQSNYDDLDMDNFLRIANALNTMERYDDALSVLKAVKYPMQRMGGKQLSQSKKEHIRILQSTILTRSKKYADALMLAKQTASTYQFPNDEWSSTGSNDLEFHSFMKEAKALVVNVDINLSEVVKKVKKTLFPSNMQQIEATSLSEMILSFTSDPYFGDQEKNIHSKTTDINLNELFRNLSDDKGENGLSKQKLIEKLDDFAKQALITLDPEYLVDVIRVSDQPISNHILSGSLSSLDPDLRRVIKSQMIDFHSREASNTLSHIAELCNTLAYSRAETGVYLEFGFHDSTVAYVVMSYLMYTSPLGTPYRNEFMKKQAQFCDTLGWVRYRDYMSRYFKYNRQSFDNSEDDPSSDHQSSTNPSFLCTNPIANSEQYANDKRAQEKGKKHFRLQYSTFDFVETFLKRGIRYDPQRAIIHYHLARVYLTYVELAWQSNPQIGQEDKLNRNVSGEIDAYLVMALREWRNAKQFDKFGRLHARLSWLYNRVSNMKRLWETRQLRSISGDKKTTSPNNTGIEG